MIQIRQAVESDFAEMWRIFQHVIVTEDTYVFSPYISLHDVHAYWFAPGVSSFVATQNSAILGMYKLIPNQRDLGSHVANASFMVSFSARGKGVGRLMGEHCISQARASGFRAIQFNFVVSTNTPAVKLWQSLGFDIVGTLPGAFKHKQLGYVDVYVMFKSLT